MSARIRLETELKKYFPNITWDIGDRQGDRATAFSVIEISRLLDLTIEVLYDKEFNTTKVTVTVDTGERIILFTKHVTVSPELPNAINSLPDTISLVHGFLKGISDKLGEAINQ